MENGLTAVDRRALLKLLCILLLGTGTSADPPTASRNPEKTAPSSGALSQRPANSTPLRAPAPKQPHTGTYDIIDRDASECLKAQMGVQYAVSENKNWLYFNMEPSSTKASGQCGPKTSNLRLKFPEGRLEFTFHKDEMMSYVTAVRASLEASVCEGCERELFQGVITDATFFQAGAGLCHKCDAETTLRFAANLSVRIVNAKIQASGITGRDFGLEEECWPDFHRRVVPIALRGVAAGVFLIALVTYLVIRDHRRRGYERL